MINRTTISFPTGTVARDVLTVRYSSTRPSVSSTIKLDSTRYRANKVADLAPKLPKEGVDRRAGQIALNNHPCP